jgi:hypothetical protein
MHKTVGSEWADYVFHNLAGWLMMPMALVFLWVEIRLLAWVLVPRPKREDTYAAFEWKRPASAANTATGQSVPSNGAAGASKTPQGSP